MFGKDEISHKIRVYLEEYGIDPLYAVTILGIVITLSYWDYFKNWKKIEGWRKGLIGSSLYATIVLMIFSLLKLFGIINL